MESFMNIKYFDNAATTKVAEEVLNEMLPYLKEKFGNPSSMYTLGRSSKRAIEEARKKVAELINCEPNEIYFTSSGSESDNTVIKGIAYQNYNKGKTAKSGKFKQFACDVDNAQDIAAHRLESIVIESAADNPKDAKWLLTKKFPDIYGDRTYNETKIDANVKTELLAKLERPLPELDDDD